MQPVRVLVADDSPFAREMLTELLAGDEGIRVVGQAVNGEDALNQVRRLRPDLVIMDIEMPVMNGLEAIGRIMGSHALPILVVTAKDDADTAYKAISKGALEVLPKPDIAPDTAEAFVRKVKLLARVRVIRHIRGKDSHPSLPGPPRTRQHPFEIVAIASSTGGPNALSAILPRLPADFPVPIVVAQHISDGFTPGMARWLDEISLVTVRQGEAGELLRSGAVYLSPSEKHMTVNRQRRISFYPRKPQDIYFPSCDRLLSSVADVYGAGSIGLILTGMGSDGVSGIGQIRAAGGYTIAQDRVSSVVFGMPRVAIESGCISQISGIGEIAPRLIRLVTG